VGTELRLESGANRVTLRLPASFDLDAALPVDVVLSGITDHAGNAHPTSPLVGSVSGDLAPPAFLSAFVDHRVAPDATVVTLRFSEAVDPAQATDGAFYTVDGGQAVDSATLLRPDVVRLVLSAPIAPGERVRVTGLADPAGNASADLDVEPVF